MPAARKGGWYAVAAGRQPGIYTSWDECSQQVKGFSNAKYKKFSTKNQAEEYIRTICSQTGTTTTDIPRISSSHSHNTKRPLTISGDENVKRLKTDEHRKPVYGVAKGHCPGVYYSWSDCQSQIKGFPSPLFRKFSSETEAKEFCSKHADQYLEKNTSKSLHTDDLVTPIDTSLSDVEIDEEGSFSPTMPEYTEKYEDGFEESNNAILKEITVLISKSQSETLDLGTRPIVYTDGSCLNQGGGPRRAGVGVFWGVGDARNCSERLWGPQTNQRAELWAAIRALQTCLSAGYKKLEVRTDSKYTIKGATEWIKRWKENGYRSANGQPVKNKELFCCLSSLTNIVDVKWVHVKAHKAVYFSCLSSLTNIVDVKWVHVKAHKAVYFSCLSSLTNIVDVKWVHVKAHNGEPGNEAADRLAKEGAKLALQCSSV
ncbi:hypothetical protein ACHWQZ_G011441 [Mnemiopsis leidyi]